jgi:sulfatase maturation enzyme AslB (radical SAM superfamily)
MDVNIHFVIALHGPEHIHNDICDSNEPGSNPFKETMESLEKIKLLYGNISEMVRIEIVLSRKNLHYLTETIKMLEEIGAIRIGISYPHLDGYEHISPEKVKKRGFSYAEMQEELKKMVDYVKERNFIISVEAVPFCAVRDTNGEIYELPADVRLIDYLEPRNSAVYFLDWKCNDFEKLWTENHSKFSFCEECLINKLCMGVWIETLRCFGANGLKPITVQEAIKIKNALKRHRMEVKGDEDKCFSYC